MLGRELHHLHRPQPILVYFFQNKSQGIVVLVIAEKDVIEVCITPYLEENLLLLRRGLGWGHVGVH
jgi:hypothetical protein